MRTIVLLTAFFAAMALGVAAQSPTPIPSKTQPNNDVVKISTNLIQIDVAVTDAKGKPIADIRPDEIEIYENGQKQKITAISYVSAGRKITEKPKTEKNAIPVPTAVIRPDQIRRTVALVVDDLTLSFESASQTRRALKRFVDEQMEEGDLVAIIRTGAGIGALQQFTSDKRILNAAIEKVKWNPVGNGGIGAFAPMEEKLPNDATTDEPIAGVRSPDGIEREFNDFRESYFATGTLGALDYVIRGMSELPGRKSVVLFSDGFQLDNVTAEGFLENSRVMEPLRRLIDEANRSSVVIYAMDPRGLVYTGVTASDNTGGRDQQQIDSELADRREKMVDTQQSLKYISEETGGFALINSNDLSGGVRRVLEDQSYYLVAYEPDGDTFDPAKRKYNKLEVKVLRTGAIARYRSGFFGVADKEKQPSSSPAGATPAEQLQYALLSPFAVNGIDLRLNALFGADAKSTPYVRSLIHIDASNLQFTDAANGSKKAVFEVLAVSFGDNGQPIDQLYKGYTLTVTPDAYKKVMKDGFVYHFIFPVKKPGAYQYRIAIRDSQGGKIGSASQFVQVPDIKKNRLTVSSIILENLSETDWKGTSSPVGGVTPGDPMTDTALRRAKVGSVLRYGFEIYNAKINGSGQATVSRRVRIFRDGKLILDGKDSPIELVGQTDMQHIKSSGALSLGAQMQAGDYILQVIVTDTLAGKKQQIATQYVQFEVVQ